MRKLPGVVAIAFGIYTFFMPLVTLSQPALGRTEWSALNIAIEMGRGKLPASHWLEMLIVDLAVAYAVLIPALITLFLRGGEKPLQLLSLTGLILSGVGVTRNAKRHFSDFLTGSSHLYQQGGVTLDAALFFLPIVLLVLFLMSTAMFDLPLVYSNADTLPAGREIDYRTGRGGPL